MILVSYDQKRKRGDHMNTENIGKLIRELRKEKGWTQRELASKLHVTDKAVSKWERGKSLPDFSTIIKTAKTDRLPGRNLKC